MGNNSEVWKIAGKIYSEIKNNVTKQSVYDAIKPYVSVDAGPEMSERMKQFMENPMSAEQEAKALRAILHVGLSKGDISPQILDKLDKIIGVSAGEDDKMEMVDFSTAFADIAESVRITRKILENEAK